MAVRPIILWPEPWLNMKSDPVLETEFGGEALTELVADLKDTLQAAKGAGLAAPQLSVHKQVVVVWHTVEGTPNVICLCNPKLASSSGAAKVASEGCLSLPGAFAPVSRFPVVTVQYRLPDGTATEATFDGHTAIAVQHEMDHLVGITLADHVGFAKRDQMRDRVRKEMRARQRAQQRVDDLAVEARRLSAESKAVATTSADYQIATPLLDNK